VILEQLLQLEQRLNTIFRRSSPHSDTLLLQRRSLGHFAATASGSNRRRELADVLILRRRRLSKSSCPAAEVTKAIDAAAAAYPDGGDSSGRSYSALFKLKQLLEDHIDDISRLITRKRQTSRSQSRDARAIENVEVAVHPDDDAGYNLDGRRARGSMK